MHAACTAKPLSDISTNQPKLQSDGIAPAHARAPPLQDMTPPARLSRMEAKYESEGLRRTVEGVLLIHQHDHPHVLLLQFGPNAFRLCAPHPSRTC